MLYIHIESMMFAPGGGVNQVPCMLRLQGFHLSLHGYYPPVWVGGYRVPVRVRNVVWCSWVRKARKDIVEIMGKPISSAGGLGTSVIGGPVMAFTFFDVFTLPVFGGLKTSSWGLGQSGGSTLLDGNSGDNLRLLMDNLIDVDIVLIDRYSRGTVVIIDGGDRLDDVASKVRVKEWYLQLLPHTHCRATRLAFLKNDVTWNKNTLRRDILDLIISATWRVPKESAFSATRI
jgi:hypothetical protein